MEYVSNTRIVLHVEVRGLSGTLMINIPPPPTDRLWYGFKPCPKLILAARPKVGAKELTMNRLTEWIEKKLELEFQVRDMVDVLRKVPIDDREKRD